MAKKKKKSAKEKVWACTVERIERDVEKQKKALQQTIKEDLEFISLLVEKKESLLRLTSIRVKIINRVIFSQKRTIRRCKKSLKQIELLT